LKPELEARDENGNFTFRTFTGAVSLKRAHPGAHGGRCRPSAPSRVRSH